VCVCVCVFGCVFVCVGLSCGLGKSGMVTRLRHSKNSVSSSL
jgi:hypothetical protein